MSDSQRNISYKKQQHTDTSKHNVRNAEITPLTEREKARFWGKVDRRGSDECWLWLSATNTSRTGAVYGQFWLHGRPVVSHRIAYFLGVGPIPDGLTIDHVRPRCQAGSLCHNPAHLEAVPLLENQYRYQRTLTKCRRGHDRVPFSGYCEICRADKARERAERRKVLA